MSDYKKDESLIAAYCLSILTVFFVGVYVGATKTKIAQQITPMTPANRFTPLGRYRVTAYCLCDKCINVSAWRDGFTASGHQIQPGDRFIAAPPEIPFGTLLSVPGYGTAPVLDRGGAIKGKRLDIYFPTHAEAMEWGVKNLEIKEVEQ